ncbi:MAG: hypothetical protein ACRD96_03500 [Bryobacteraceae bacterium]
MTRIVALCLLCLAAAGAQPKKKAPPPAQQTLTGCMDEGESGYVLRDTAQLRAIAALEPVGFDKQIFAQYVGHKVEVKGERSKQGDPPVMKVRAVKKIAELCTPSC